MGEISSVSQVVEPSIQLGTIIKKLKMYYELKYKNQNYKVNNL